MPPSRIVLNAPYSVVVKLLGTVWYKHTLIVIKASGPPVNRFLVCVCPACLVLCAWLFSFVAADCEKTDARAYYMLSYRLSYTSSM
jgi:hypothetical protein